MRLIDADALAGRLDPLVLVEALRRGHRAGGMPQVERLFLEEVGGDDGFLVWSGWRRGEAIAVKAASIFPGNAAKGAGANIQSVVLLFGGKDGRPLAAIHGESFTRMKTAADSALAADILAGPDAETLTVIGAGGQAETHIRFLLAVRPGIRRVRICNRSAEKAEALAAAIRRRGLDAAAAPDREDAVRGADILSCLTASRTPVFRGEWLKHGAHVDLVGGFTPAMRESDDETMRRARLFADTRRFTLADCGDYVQPLASGVISPERIEGDLFDLCSGRVEARRSEAEIHVFKNGGGGHLDLMVAEALYRFAEAGGPGTGRR